MFAAPGGLPWAVWAVRYGEVNWDLAAYILMGNNSLMHIDSRREALISAPFVLRKESRSGRQYNRNCTRSQHHWCSHIDAVFCHDLDAPIRSDMEYHVGDAIPIASAASQQARNGVPED